MSFRCDWLWIAEQETGKVASRSHLVKWGCLEERHLRVMAWGPSVWRLKPDLVVFQLMDESGLWAVEKKKTEMNTLASHLQVLRPCSLIWLPMPGDRNNESEWGSCLSLGSLSVGSRFSRGLCPASSCTQELLHTPPLTHNTQMMKAFMSNGKDFLVVVKRGM